jgi:uncharacterized protein YbcI
MGQALTPAERAMLRANETRLALEAARRRCRMFLADPVSDLKTAEQVLMEVPDHHEHDDLDEIDLSETEDVS